MTRRFQMTADFMDFLWNLCQVKARAILLLQKMTTRTKEKEFNYNTLYFASSFRATQEILWIILEGQWTYFHILTQGLLQHQTFTY